MNTKVAWQSLMVMIRLNSIPIDWCLLYVLPRDSQLAQNRGIFMIVHIFNGLRIVISEEELDAESGSGDESSSESSDEDEASTDDEGYAINEYYYT